MSILNKCFQLRSTNHYYNKYDESDEYECGYNIYNNVDAITHWYYHHVTIKKLPAFKFV